MKIIFVVVILVSVASSTRNGQRTSPASKQHDSSDVANTQAQDGRQFKSRTDETKWKMNIARKKLRIAKDYLKLAKKATKKHKTAKNTPENQHDIRDIIRKAEKQMMNAGEKMGLSYMHYKRSFDNQ